MPLAEAACVEAAGGREAGSVAVPSRDREGAFGNAETAYKVSR
jgi:hypothetical protein